MRRGRHRLRAACLCYGAPRNRLGCAPITAAFAELLAFGGCFLLVIKNKPTPAKVMGGVGAGMLILAIVAFIARPSLAAVEEAQAKAGNAQPAPDRFAGPNLCRLVQERSRLTISTGADVPLDWNANGCVNGRTQYAQNGDVWRRIMISNEQPVVSISEFRPATGDFTSIRNVPTVAVPMQLRCCDGCGVVCAMAEAIASA